MAYVNDVAALNPENWKDMLQENIYKELVAKEVCDTRFKADLANGKKVHFPIFGSLTTTAYVKGTDVTVQALDSSDEYLEIDQQWESSFYLDTVDKKQNLYSTMEAGVRELTDALAQKVETLAFAQVLNAYDTFDAGDAGMGGSNGDAIALTTSNVATMFARAKGKLRAKLGGKKMLGNMVAVVDSDVAAIIEEKATTSGFNIADAAFKNGYAGDYMGVKIYISENLDTTTDSRKHCYFGLSKQIGLAMQIEPTIQIDKDPLKFGHIVKALEVFGLKTFTRRGERFLDLQVTVA
jgi:hypothetical protein